MLERIGRPSTQGRHVRGVRNTGQQGGRILKDNQSNRRTTHRPMAGPGAQSRKEGAVLGDGRALSKVARPTRKTWAQLRRIWVNWRVMRQKANWVRGGEEPVGAGGRADGGHCLPLRGEEEQGVDLAGKFGSSERVPQAVGGVVIAAAAFQYHGKRKRGSRERT